MYLFWYIVLYQISTIDRTGGDRIRDAEGEAHELPGVPADIKTAADLIADKVETREHFHSVPNLWKFVELWGHGKGRRLANCGNVEICGNAYIQGLADTLPLICGNVCGMFTTN